LTTHFHLLPRYAPPNTPQRRVLQQHCFFFFLYTEQNDCGARARLRLSTCATCSTATGNRPAHLYLRGPASQNPCGCHRMTVDTTAWEWIMRRLACSVETTLVTDLVVTESFSRVWKFINPGNNSCQTTLRGSFPVCRTYRSVITATGYRQNCKVRFLGK
jgi:hypothetical protein